MEELNKHGKLSVASMKSDMSRKTGAKYQKSGKLPSETAPTVRGYRTRSDVFAKDWPLIEAKLELAPALEGKALFDWLMEQQPGRYEPGQLRTFHRRVKLWRSTLGPDKEVFFAQEHRPGEAMQVDGTWATELGVTINGELFEHMLCHSVLPYSNWEWATVCRSESLMALRRGIQSALFRLGRVPEYIQTDNSTAATHDLKTGKRGFNEDYERFVKHFGMTPRTIGIGKSNQNGDVESSNNALKKRLKQHLILRGSSDFESVEAYETWLWEMISKNNALRTKRVSEELASMKELVVSRLREHKDERVRVSRESTIRVMQNTYSVPSRLCGEKVKVRIFDERLEVFYGGRKQLTLERLLGSAKHRIDYRHIIWSLVRKPGAFPQYRYREELFPSLIFRKAYDRLNDMLGSGYKADQEYLRVLHHAAAVSESDVETALELLLTDGHLPLADQVKALVEPRQPKVCELKPYEVNLGEYDGLLMATVVGS
jgi:hypothetical protein